MGCAFHKEAPAGAERDSPPDEAGGKSNREKKLELRYLHSRGKEEERDAAEREKKDKTGRSFELLSPLSFRKYRRQLSEATDSIFNARKPTKETAELVVSHNPADGSKSINQYTILRSIGSGAYGKVKLAVSSENSQFYAVKILIKSQLKRKRVGMKKGSAYEDVMREIELMKRMDSPYIIKLVEVIDDPSSDKLYMIMDFAEGGPTMKSELECEPIPEPISRKYLHDIICGLEYIHSLKIIHRDIKPENLLVTIDGSVKISDFGVSTMIESKEDIKQFYKSVGSPIFIPPELCTENAKIIPSAIDVWCLGICLYYFTFGKPPFLGDTEMELYERIKNNKVDFPSVPETDPQLRDLLKRLLHKDPKYRITVKDLKKHPWTKFDSLERPPQSSQ